jgi:disulfide oxidoreductase YuzD
MEDMSTRSGNKLTEEQIEQLIKRLRGVEHIEPIVTIEDSNVNNEKMATFAVTHVSYHGIWLPTIPSLQDY